MRFECSKEPSPWCPRVLNLLRFLSSAVLLVFCSQYFHSSRGEMSDQTIKVLGETIEIDF